MPRPSIKSRPSKRRTYKSSKKARTYPVGSIPRYVNNSTSIAGMPDGKVIRMNYSERIALAGSSGAHAFNTWNANSIFDPNYTLTGHQPYGHDEYNQFYRKYLVLGCKVTTSFEYASTSLNTQPVACFAVLDEDLGLPTFLHTKEERYPEKVKYLHPYDVKEVNIVNYYDAAKWHKITQAALTADHQSVAAFGANPDKGVYLHTGIQSSDSSSTSSQVQIRNRFQFIVKLLEPLPILGS